MTDAAYVPPLKPTHKKVAIILNGPPGSGKDTIATELINILEEDGTKAKHLEVKARLFELAISISGMPAKQWWSLYNNRETKEVPHRELFGLSPRQFMIHISENIMKPLAGNDYFGKFAAKKVHESAAEVLVFTDGGFKEEVLEISKYAEILLVYLNRPGTSFDGDSRSYIPFEDHIQCAMRVNNNGTVEAAAEEILEAYLDME